MQCNAIFSKLKNLFNNPNLQRTDKSMNQSVSDDAVVYLGSVLSGIQPYGDNIITELNINDYLNYNGCCNLRYILLGLGLTGLDNDLIKTTNITKETINEVMSMDTDARKIMYMQIYEQYRTATHLLRLLPVFDGKGVNIVELRDLTLSNKEFVEYTNKCVEYILEEYTQDVNNILSVTDTIDHSVGLSVRQQRRDDLLFYLTVLANVKKRYQKDIKYIKDNYIEVNASHKSTAESTLERLWYFIGIWYWLQVGYKRIVLSPRLNTIKCTAMNNIFSVRSKNVSDDNSNVVDYPPTHWVLNNGIKYHISLDSIDKCTSGTEYINVVNAYTSNTFISANY